MPLAMPAPTRDIVVVHSSDLHIDHDYTARLHGGDGTAGLTGVLDAARHAGADVVVLAGDTFDCHRVPADLLVRAADVISSAAMPVVILPGNHDPAVPDAVYRHAALAGVANLSVIGVSHDESVLFSELGLEILGASPSRLWRHDSIRAAAGAHDPLADRHGAWTLRAGSGPNDETASVLAHRR